MKLKEATKSRSLVKGAVEICDVGASPASQLPVGQHGGYKRKTLEKTDDRARNVAHFDAEDIAQMPIRLSCTPSPVGHKDKVKCLSLMYCS